ncbi:23S rRNA (uracil(1939)-C(5))-methyltransferase RlmD [bacterium]|nr:23S rRNA (uracil(1939)-C(5))-methyltransferase RlmD [candidate division CSSED10-310 bacterium]
MNPLDEEELLEKLRKKLGTPQKSDERAQLEKIFGKAAPSPEEKLKQKLKQKTLNIGEIIDIYIEKIAFGGEGIGRHGNAPVFVEGTVPGDTARVRIDSLKNDTVRAQLLDIIAPSSNRTKPKCPLFGKCGGCSLQNLVYTAQLKAKQEMLRDVLLNIAKIETQIRNPIASPETYGYRLRCTFHLETSDSGTNLGYHARGTHEVIGVENCPIAAPLINRILPALTSLLPAPGTAELPDTITIHTDIEQKSAVIHMTAQKPVYYQQELFTKLKETGLPIAGVSADGYGQMDIAGTDILSNQIIPYQFELHGNSFFQINRFLLKSFISNVIQLTSPNANDILLDLYCGTGFFSIPLGKYLRSLTGLDSDQSACNMARRNAELNGLSNIEFLTADDGAFFSTLPENARHANFIIADPPRNGLHRNVLQAIVQRKPPKLLYISCNPPTFARDLASLVAADFRIRVIQPIDLFPHSHHIETIAFLTHRYTGVQAASAIMPDLR